MISDYGQFSKYYDSTSIKLINTPSKQARDAFFYIQEIGHIGAVKPHLSRREKLNSYLLVIVEKGMGYLNYNGKSYTLHEGQGFFIDCTKTYEQGSSAESPWCISWVHLYGSTSTQYYQLYQHRHSPILSPNNFYRYKELLALMLDKSVNKTASTELECSLHIVELLTLLLGTTKAIETPQSPMALKCNNIKLYLDENFTSSISLDDLAQEFYISKFYMLREFKKAYGQSIVDYLISKRITHAKQLLRYTNDSINEIAQACGFHDQGYFNKQFKKSEQITGKEYRKLWL